MSSDDILSLLVVENEGSLHSKGFTNGYKVVRSHREEVNKWLGGGLRWPSIIWLWTCNILTFPHC